ncbi:MAG: molybdenum cofactor guanylyltransferase [Betaproteobacteria bacterium]|nr:molybdenum cofactor guanylyltransferase [Betaproteobacteria bacterium]MDH3438049.1 molybdenum cofactor guanylyltransferase [Betaproteobacteria bacterium]
MELGTWNVGPGTDKITGVILAGGRGQRMGSVDKGLKLLRGKPMVAWVIERFAPQVDELLVNANQNLDRYAQLGHRVIPDAIEGFAGPLAGLERALAEARHELVATVPCDSPHLALDLIERLRGALQRHEADLAVAKTGAQAHPVFCLCRKSVSSSLTEFLAGGGRKIDAWYSRLKVIEVAFDDEPGAFSNVNTKADLEALENEPPP